MGRLSISKYIGESFKTKTNAILEVTGITKGLKKNKLILTCSSCSKDKELYPHGSITSTYTDLSKGKVPCGCSNSIRTESQNKVLAKRAAESKGLVFLGWSKDTYNKKKTFVRLYNPKLEYCWDTTSLQYLLSTDNVCCPETKRLGNRRSSDEFLTKAREVYPVGTIFKRDESGTLDKTGREMYWYVTCPICEKDEYTLNKVSTGTFRVTTNALRNGQVSCRCAKDRYQRTYKEYVYYINKVGNKTGYKLDTSKYKSFTSRDNVEYTCPEGHTCNSRLGIYLFNPTCGTCNSGGFSKVKPAHLYIVRWYGFGKSYLKFGITNREVIDRVKEQSTPSSLDYEILHTVYNESGETIFNLESLLKQSVETSVCPSEWLPDGYTETCEDTEDNLQTLLKLIST